jgi:hypothetical protein
VTVIEIAATAGAVIAALRINPANIAHQGAQATLLVITELPLFVEPSDEMIETTSIRTGPSVSKAQCVT